jgi:tripartite ATP-independent transporter DctM subunit
MGPRLPPDENEPSLGAKLLISVRALVPPVFLIAAVLGSIMLGWATPTEAAAMGAAGSVLLTLIYRTFTFDVLSQALVKTILVTAMILMILLGGTMFAGVFIASGGMAAVQEALTHTGLSAWPTLFLILFLAFVAGFVLDLISIILIFIPIAILLMKQFGFDEIWFCILFLIVIQTSYLTPPMAPAIFYLRGIAPPSITLLDMYKGVVPFIVLQVITLAIVMAFPQAVLWLPSKLLGFN